MSLDDLKAQAEATEEEVEQPEVEAEDKPRSERLADLEKERDENLAEDESEDDGETEEAENPEPSEDFEFELDDEKESTQQKRDPVEVLTHKLSRERKKKQEARSEVDELKDQIQHLTQMMQGGQRTQQASQPSQSEAEPTIPDLYDSGIDGDRQKYDAAMKRWFSDYQKFQNRHSEAEQAQDQHRQTLDNMTKGLAERAAKFSSENNVSVDRVADALDKATSEIDKATGIDGSLAYLLDSVGEGGERVAYYLGTNANAMSQVQNLLKEDNKGFRAISHMTRLAEKLKPKHSKRISKAPAPDEPLKGDASTASNKRLQEMYDKETNPNKLMELRKKAKERGVKLT